MRLWVLKRRLAGLGLIGVVVLVLIGAALWKFWPQPNCTDGVKNGEEEDIDCGGTCPRQCLGELPVPPRLLWQRFFRVRPGVYDVGAMIENRNIKLGTRRLTYHFALYTQDGILLDKTDGETYLLPGEKTFIFSPGLVVGEQKPQRVDFSYEESIVWERMENELPTNIEIVAHDFESTPYPLVRAKLANRALFEERALEVVALLKDDEDNVIAASRTTLENLGASSRAEVVFTWPSSSFSKTPTVEILYRRIPR